MDSLDDIQVIIPAYNEASTIGGVVEALMQQGLQNIRVVANACTDETAQLASEAGAKIIKEPRRGYGQACWSGYQRLEKHIAWVLFCDADGSDDLGCLPSLISQRSRYDFILGNRRSFRAGRSAMTWAQNYGNSLAVALIWLFWGFRFHDLGPMRLIKRESLERISMRDRNFGWTVEMQIRALEAGLRILEVSVGYRTRAGGRSKISGTVSGTIMAGSKILWTVFRLRMSRTQRR